jgi:hypothetical protein
MIAVAEEAVVLMIQFVFVVRLIGVAMHQSYAHAIVVVLFRVLEIYRVVDAPDDRLVESDFCRILILQQLNECSSLLLQMTIQNLLVPLVYIADDVVLDVWSQGDHCQID